MDAGTLPRVYPKSTISDPLVWRKIELAPTDGRPVLVYCPLAPEGDRQFVASWQSNRGADGKRSIIKEWCEVATQLPGLDRPHEPAVFAALPIGLIEPVLKKLGLNAWLPIGEAPRTGMPLIIFDPHLVPSRRIFAGRWESTDGTAKNRSTTLEWCEVATGLPGIVASFSPSHFMFLPSDPISEQVPAGCANKTDAN